MVNGGPESLILNQGLPITGVIGPESRLVSRLVLGTCTQGAVDGGPGRRRRIDGRHWLSTGARSIGRMSTSWPAPRAGGVQLQGFTGGANRGPWVGTHPAADRFPFFDEEPLLPRRAMLRFRGVLGAVLSGKRLSGRLRACTACVCGSVRVLLGIEVGSRARSAARAAWSRPRLDRPLRGPYVC